MLLPGRPALIQLLSQAALSSMGFVVPVLAAGLGASLAEVGAVGASYGAAQFVAAAAGGHLADRHGRRRLLKVGLLASALACLLHVVASGPWALVAARGAFGFAAGLFPPALLSIAYDANRRLGAFTGWGGLGFAVGAAAGGLLVLSTPPTPEHLRVVFLVASGILLACHLVALTIRAPPEHDVVVHFLPAAVIRRNAAAYATMLLRHVGAAAVWLVFPLYLVELGLPLAWVGFVHAANGLFQFLLMPRMDAFAPRPLVVAGCLLSAATFGGFLAAREAWHFLALQPVLAAAWAALYMGLLKHVLEHRAEERATATGFLQSSIHLSNVVGPAVGGLVAAAAGYEATFVLALVLSLAAAVPFLAASRAHARGCAGAAHAALVAPRRP